MGANRIHQERSLFSISIGRELPAIIIPTDFIFSKLDNNSLASASPSGELNPDSKILESVMIDRNQQTSMRLQRWKALNRSLVE